MQKSLQGKRTELKKVGDPNANGSMHRSSYYCKVNFLLNKKAVDVVMKVDTGASYTVIGLDYPGIDRYTNEIMSNNINNEAFDASGSKLNLNGYVVENFQLTEDIIIPKLLIFFSKELKDKAILGMDILSLFDFQYLREKRSTNGTFWINNYQDVLDNISKRMLNQELDYLDPSLILSIVIEDTNKNNVKFTLQDAMAAYINKKISEDIK